MSLWLVDLFRRRLDHQSRSAQEMSRASFAAFVVHQVASPCRRECRAKRGFGPREPFEVLVEQRQELVRLIGTPDDPRRHCQPLTLHQDVDVAVVEEVAPPRVTGHSSVGLFRKPWRRSMLEIAEIAPPAREDVMKAQVGDRIILAGTRVDDPVRDGEVLEVKGSDGGAPYTVRWSDGHTGLVYPGPGAVMKVESGTAPSAPRSKIWRVQVSVAETGDNTRATALLISDQPVSLRGQGDSHRSPQDEPKGAIGDEVAVARALRHLADSLLAQAESDIEAVTGTDAYVRPLLLSNDVVQGTLEGKRSG